MAKPACSYCLLFALLVSFASAAKDDQDKQVYIVYMGALPARVDYMPMSHHTSLLQEVIGESSIENRLVRSYKRSFNGFAARLTESEREILANMEDVVSVFPSKKLKLQTTMSWDFMGLKEGKRAKRNPSIESNTIIGVIDSGIYPESESFSDKGFGPPPKKWKGVCEGGTNFSCNNKLIGARSYTPKTNEFPHSARDNMGHGTHTASTAAGNAVKDVSFYGLGNGTARGGVPAARIAVYKVCEAGFEGCTGDGILSAYDDAIADNVDLITISIGGDTGQPFEVDPTAIGAFHAMAKGILTLNSAGNSGPESSTVSSIAPWIFTVAASNTNRGFVTKVVLGDGKTVGRSVNSFDLKGTKYPLVYGESATRSCDADSARFCSPGCLDSKLVKGKIVLCDSAEHPDEAQAMGAIASITKSSKADFATIFSFSVSVLSEDDYNTVLSYMNSTKNPKAAVLKSGTTFKQTAPVIASYSSRGPNTIIPDILKPDITAPGSEILAAYSPDAPPSKSDTRHVKYSLLTGTSMSCPHVAGVAAYLKTFHPRWSPSMIQSAIMTTAWPMNASASPINEMDEFAYGAGHVDPISAIHPGLVYEANKSDHIAFLCGLNYTGKNLKLISGDSVSCTKEQTKSLPRNLNYPSMTAQVSATKPFKVAFRRTVTNVGMSNSTYKAKVVGTKLKAKVVPGVLSFKSLHEKKSFTVTVSGKGPGAEKLVSTHLIWSDGFHSVRSPIVVYASY
ncbi:subtilisin-like protease SBT4.5 isoform X2 [Eutrema salsugineum]|uniref:subtilisin-like protease SBT4.5 isoform X2 n=1 Tax=Eutrema salsugineum TaxID=72664 RepID=UPI000CED7AF7|nr:subtilisin-like protease SBT4.5 isoform X2 [Eutrema salsugineum]